MPHCKCKTCRAHRLAMKKRKRRKKKKKKKSKLKLSRGRTDGESGHTGPGGYHSHKNISGNLEKRVASIVGPGRAKTFQKLERNLGIDRALKRFRNRVGPSKFARLKALIEGERQSDKSNARGKQNKDANLKTIVKRNIEIVQDVFGKPSANRFGGKSNAVPKIKLPNGSLSSDFKIGALISKKRKSAKFQIRLPDGKRAIATTRSGLLWRIEKPSK